MAERGDLTVLHEPFCNLKDYGETDAGGHACVRPLWDRPLKRNSSAIRAAQKSHGLLTLPPTDDNASYVSYGHCGMSCGWTICPAPGHMAVARRGAQPVDLAMHATPPGPNTHANTTGYGVIAQALEQQLP